DLVELVPTAELGTDRVPQELHELDPLDRVDAARAAQVEVEVAAQVRVLEIARVRVEINEPARHRLLDQVLDLHVGMRRQHPVRGKKLVAFSTSACTNTSSQGTNTLSITKIASFSSRRLDSG